MIAARHRAEASIARVEVRSAGGDPVATRLRVERLLGALALRPRGLAPAAVLCVRELLDPLPGVLALDGRQARPPAAWEQALQRRLDRLARAAARPAREAVPAAAEAVVFEDEAELLACLGKDLVLGALGARWWWPLLVDGLGQPRRAVGGAFRRSVEHAPAALQRLAQERLAEAVVAALAGEDVTALTAAVQVRFALPAVEPAAQRSRSGGAAEGTAPGPIAPAPWRKVAWEAEAPDLTPARRELLGVALTLARAPALARSTAFAAELAAWRAFAAVAPLAEVPAIPRGDPAAPAAPVESGPVAAAPVAAAPEAAASLAPRGTASVAIGAPAGVAAAVAGADATVAAPALSTVVERTRDEPSATLVAPATPPPAVAELLTAPAAPIAPSAPITAAVEPPTPPEAPATGTAPAAPTRWSSDAARQRSPLSVRPRTRAFGAAIDTELGGIFYLIDLALHLELYGDAENLTLPFWDFLALVGRELLDEGSSDDPIWGLLAELAGRSEAEPPGAGFAPPPEWRLPARWLATFERTGARHAVVEGRLLVAHPEGFLLLDVPASGDPQAQLAGELAAWGMPAAPASATLTGPPGADPLGRWLARLLPYLRARVRQALGVDDAALSAALLRHRARVHATDTHVDVVLPLEGLPVSIRFAGLDRDPGWIAAGGRFVAFHYQ